MELYLILQSFLNSESAKILQANLGFAAQYAATNTDPITNLTDHLRDPTHINFATNGVSLPFY